MTAAELFERDYVRPRPGRTLIVGSKVYEGREDRRKRYANAVGVDMLAGEGVDMVVNLEQPLPAKLGLFDHVECMSVLEHSRRPWKLAANLQRLMKPDATLHLTAPFVWRVHGYPDDYFRFTRQGIRSLFEHIGWVRMSYAHVTLKNNDLLRSIEVPETGYHPYYARTEVVGFGVKHL